MFESLLCSVVLSGCVHIKNIFGHVRSALVRQVFCFFPINPALVRISAVSDFTTWQVLYLWFKVNQNVQSRNVCILCCSYNGLMQYHAGAFQNKPPWKGSGAVTGAQQQLSAPSVWLLVCTASWCRYSPATFHCIQTNWVSWRSYVNSVEIITEYYFELLFAFCNQTYEISDKPGFLNSYLFYY